MPRPLVPRTMKIIADDQDFTQEWLRSGQMRAVLAGLGG